MPQLAALARTQRLQQITHAALRCHQGDRTTCHTLADRGALTAKGIDELIERLTRGCHPTACARAARATTSTQPPASHRRCTGGLRPHPHRSLWPRHHAGYPRSVQPLIRRSLRETPPVSGVNGVGEAPYGLAERCVNCVSAQVLLQSVAQRARGRSTDSRASQEQPYRRRGGQRSHR